MQHRLAIFLAEQFLGGRDTKEDRILLTYGIEIFLNEFLKFVLVMILGVIFGYWKITLLSAVYILVIRQILGGRHFESNILCTLYTVLSSFIFPAVVSNINFSFKLIILFIMVETGIVFLFCSYDNNTVDRNHKKSIVAIVIFLLFLFIAQKTGGIRFVGGLVSVHLLVEIMCMKVFPHQKADEGTV